MAIGQVGPGERFLALRASSNQQGTGNQILIFSSPEQGSG